MPELDALLTKIIVDDYHQAIHGGLERPPAAVYAEGMREAMPAPLKDARELRIALGIPETRQIRPEGIVHERLWYTEGLDGLRRRLGNGAEVEIRVDPLDVGRIQVLDPEERRFVEVGVEPARRADACGLPLFSHQRIREEVRRKGKNEHDRGEYARTREEIWQAMRGKDGRRRPARGPWARSGSGGMRRVRAAGDLGTARLDVLDGPAPDGAPETPGAARPVGAKAVDRPSQAPARPAAGNAGPAAACAAKDAPGAAARKEPDAGETAPPSVAPVPVRAGTAPHAPAWRVVKH